MDIYQYANGKLALIYHMFYYSVLITGNRILSYILAMLNVLVNNKSLGRLSGLFITQYHTSETCVPWHCDSFNF